MPILVQSFLNSATRLSTTATTATTVAQLKTLVNVLEGVSTSVMEFYIVNPSTTATVLVSGTLGSYGITTATTIYSSNTISTSTNKVDRQLAKLELAQLRRQASGNTTTNYYRNSNIYDIDLLADKYTSNTSTVGTTSTLVIGRPWIQDQVYTNLIFTYGEARISFTLKANGTFENVTCPYGAGGYPYGEGVVPVITMPGNQLIGGTTPANDIQWEYTVDAPGGATIGFTYVSGTPP
jgi:hypothetical protein